MNKKSREKLREIKAGYNAVKQKLSATNEEIGELEQKLDYGIDTTRKRYIFADG